MKTRDNSMTNMVKKVLRMHQQGQVAPPMEPTKMGSILEVQKTYLLNFLGLVLLNLGHHQVVEEAKDIHIVKVEMRAHIEHIMKVEQLVLHQRNHLLLKISCLVHFKNSILDRHER